jgi:DNA polymerase III subunit epsilon
MNIQLTKPIAFFDLETTGVNIGKDRIIEIGMVRIKPDGTKKIMRKLINPEMPIPPIATSINGISNEMVKDAPTFKEAAGEIKHFLEDCDLGGYNSNKFDLPMLVEEFLRVGVEFEFEKRKFIDAQRIFHMLEPRTLTAALKYYCNKELENAHTAEADAIATWEVFDAQIARYPQLGTTLDTVLQVVGEEEVVDFAKRMVYDNNQIVFNFGKHKGKPVEHILKTERSYYDWMMQGDFPQHTKLKLTEILTKMLLKNKINQ